MGLLKYIYKALAETKPSKRQTISSPNINTYPLLTLLNTGNYQHKAFKNWVSVCIFKRADGIAKIANRAIDIRSDKPLPPEHWLTQLLASPNIPAKITWVQIKKSICHNLDHTGNAFVWMPRTLGNIVTQYPTQMYVLPSSCVTIVTGTNGELIRGYCFTLGSNRFYAPVDEMCHFKTLKPSMSFDRQFMVGSPILMDAAIDAIDVDADVRAYIKTQFENQLIEPLVLSTADEIDSQEQVDIMRSRLNRELADRNVVGVLDGGKMLSPVPTNGIGAEAIGSSIANESNIKLIAGVFGVPYGMLDTSSQQNVSTAESNERSFQLECLEPLMTDIESAFNSYFSQFDLTVAITHDQYKYVDRAFQLNENKFFLDYGIKTRNELRTENGLDPIEGGDEPLLPMGLTTWENATKETEATIDVTPPTQPAPQPTEKPDDEPNNEEPSTNTDNENKLLTSDLRVKRFEELSADEKFVHWKALDTTNQKSRTQIVTIWKSAFNNICKEVVSNLDKIDLDKNKSLVEKAGVSSDINIDLFNVDKWISTLSKQNGVVLTALARDIVKQTLLHTGKSISETEFTKLINESVKFSTSKIADSINTVDSELKCLIEKTIQDNPKYDKSQLFEAIKSATEDKFSRVYSVSRAKNIATTTSTFATGKAQEGTIKQIGYDKIWMSQRDGRVRISHLAVDGKSPDADGNFSVGADKMPHPAGGQSPEENCFCRCYLFAQKPEGN